MIRFRRSTTIAAVISVAGVAMAAWVRLGPVPADLFTPLNQVSTSVFDRHGVPLYEARSAAGTRTLRLEATHLPQGLVNATLVAEDRRFYAHAGVDPLAMSRAAIRNLRAGRTVEGGSTITQQVAKLLLNRRAGDRPRPRNVRSKLAEAILALRLEHRFTKQEILALYLNLAPYGNQTTGAGRASEMYFGVRPSELTVAQAAFLAALPQRPSAFNPYRQNTAVVKRQRQILAAMASTGMITGDDARTARQETLRLRPWQPAFVAPHFVESVLRAHAHDRPARLDTTLDATLQAEVEGIVAAHRDDLMRHGAHNVAVVVLDNDTSSWLAWEGSGRYDDAEHGGAIDGVLAPRQPGSALKPFVYGVGFERGDTPATVLADIPSSYPTAQPGVVYTPRNYDGQFHGPLRARQALAGSQNVPAVEVASRVGVPELLRFFRSVGFETFDRTASYYGLGVALGNAEVSLAQMVGAYASIARGGVYQEPTFVRGVVSPPRRVMSPRAAFWITDILSDDDARAYVFGRGGALEFPYPVAVKTGTSQAYRDNWTIGYTRDVTVGVWVGNFDRQPLVGSSGVTGAGPIFHAVMLAAQRHARGHEEEGAAIVDRPVDLAPHAICALSGMAAGAMCPRRISEWLPRGASPRPCDWHHAAEDGVLTLWPDRYADWASKRGLIDPRDPAASVERVHDVAAAPRRAHPAPAHERLTISSPPEGATYLIDPTLRADFQTLPFKAVAAKGQVAWSVDGQPLSIPAGTVVHWTLVRGSHLITAHDGRSTASVTIAVK